LVDYKKQVVAHSRMLGKRLFFEGKTHLQRMMLPPGAPGVVIFPSGQPPDPASNLRAWLLAPELRKLGWRAVVVPAHLDLPARRRILKAEEPDVILMQQTRHPLNDPHLYAPIPCVLDADDADYLDPRHQKRIISIATGAAAVTAGSRFISECFSRHNPKTEILWTCTPNASRASSLPPEKRPPILAWAHSAPLMYTHEMALVKEVALGVAERMKFSFWLFGTKPGEADDYFAPMVAKGIDCVAIPLMNYDAYLAKVAEAAVGMQPVCTTNEFSWGKSFGKILAYLAGGVAVVASDAVDHPLFFRHGENGMLVNTPAEWIDAVSLLLSEPGRRAQMARIAFADFESQLTLPVFASRMDSVLRNAARSRVVA